MFKIAGVILCIAGSTGYGIMKIETWKTAMKEMEQWILLFEKIKSYIYYRRDTITDIFCKMDNEIYGICGKYVTAVGYELRDNRSKDVFLAWKEIMAGWERNSALPGKVKNCLMHFPEYVGEQDYEQQINHLDFFLEMLYREKENLDKELDSKKKPVMAMSLGGGIMVSLLLL